jgi:hypothetical protein
MMKCTPEKVAIANLFVLLGKYIIMGPANFKIVSHRMALGRFSFDVRSNHRLCDKKKLNYDTGCVEESRSSSIKREVL